MAPEKKGGLLGKALWTKGQCSVVAEQKKQVPIWEKRGGHQQCRGIGTKGENNLKEDSGGSWQTRATIGWKKRQKSGMAKEKTQGGQNGCSVVGFVEEKKVSRDKRRRSRCWGDEESKQRGKKKSHNVKKIKKYKPGVPSELGEADQGR